MNSTKSIISLILLILSANSFGQPLDQKLAQIDQKIEWMRTADYYQKVELIDSLPNAQRFYFFEGDSSYIEAVRGYYLSAEICRIDAIGSSLLLESQGQTDMQFLYDEKKLIFVEIDHAVLSRKTTCVGKTDAYVIYKIYFENDSVIYTEFKKSEKADCFGPEFFTTDYEQIMATVDSMRLRLDQIYIKQFPEYIAWLQRVPKSEPINITWVPKLEGDFSFAKRKQSISCEAWCYEYAGTTQLVATRSADTVHCYTICDAATHCSLLFSIVGDKIENPRIELTSIVKGGSQIYFRETGFIKIDQRLFEKGILKAEFDFTFYHPRNPAQPMFWKGRIYAKIK